jgi:hypothetical protein
LIYTGHSHPYSLSALQRILIPIPSLLYNIFTSLFPLCSTTYSHHYSPSCPTANSHRYSCSAPQHILIPIPFWLYTILSPLFPLCFTAH